MDATEIAGLESALEDFLGEFDDCFGRSEPRERLLTYVSGQLSDLKRKSVEPIALAADVPPRTLQRFLELVEWDQERLRDKLQHTRSLAITPISTPSASSMRPDIRRRVSTRPA